MPSWAQPFSCVGPSRLFGPRGGVRMWHCQSGSVRCVCSLPVGRATLCLLVRSNGARCADALGSRRVSTSSESTGRLARQPVVSGRLRTPSDRGFLLEYDAAAATRKQRRTHADARRVALRHKRLCHCGRGARSNCRCCMPPSIPIRTKMPANGRQILRPLQGGSQALHD